MNFYYMFIIQGVFMKIESYFSGIKAANEAVEA